MYDSAPIALQRSQGAAAVTLGTAGKLERLYQKGCAKAFLPRTHTVDPEIVFLNTAGGLTAGDRLSYEIGLGPKARATATTQTAERAYRAADMREVARVEVRAKVADGAELHWLPQETILFDGASLHRRTRIDLAGDARLLMCEMLVLGRRAMGEEVTALSLLDRREVFRDGTPVFVEPLAICSDDLVRSSAGAGVSGLICLATVVLVAERAEDWLGPVRDAIGETSLAAASAWDGKLVVRAQGTEARGVRELVACILRTLRAGPMPRVWQV